MLTPYTDEYFMKQAIAEAEKAREAGEIPVGAVITFGGRIVARAHNQVEQLQDVTAHAEIIAITAAAQAIGYKYLNECTMYVTLEPCVMCAGALHWAQLGKLIYGASDDKRGFMRYGKEVLHPSTEVLYGMEEFACRHLLQDFFKALRN